MKAFVIAATSLALGSAAFAQTAQTVPSDPTPTPVEQAAGKAVDAAKDAAHAAGNAAVAAGEAAENAAKSAVDAAKNAADDAMKAADKAGEAAATAASDAANEAGKVAGQAATATQDAANKAANEAADAADKAADSAAQAVAKAKEAVSAPDVAAPAITAEQPGVLGSWVTSRRIWTTNDPSVTPWQDATLTERPSAWVNVAKIDDVVMDDHGQLVGYIADIGGFLGIGAKKVLLGKDAIHLMRIGNDSFYATNFTKAELEALPDFDASTVLK